MEFYFGFIYVIGLVFVLLKNESSEAVFNLSLALWLRITPEHWSHSALVAWEIRIITAGQL
jgi:hypothetical protein